MPGKGEARSYAQTRVGIEGSKRQSGNSVMSLERPRAGTPVRSASPAYRADVPHGIESGTDTEAEGDPEQQSTPHSRTSNPPIPPPKDRVQGSYVENEQDSADLSPGDEALDQFQSIEHTSHSTFIAPALPPIRFSMNTADFSELLTSVGGLPSLKSLDHLAKTTTNGHTPSTPPSTASLSHDQLSSDQASAPRSSDKNAHQLTPTASSASLSASASDIRIVTSDTPGDADETLDPAVQKAMEAIQAAKDVDSDNVNLDVQSLESILRSFETYKAESTHLKQRYERVNVRPLHLHSLICFLLQSIREPANSISMVLPLRRPSTTKSSRLVGMQKQRLPAFESYYLVKLSALLLFPVIVDVKNCTNK